jgi:hypothetical protein
MVLSEQMCPGTQPLLSEYYTSDSAKVAKIGVVVVSADSGKHREKNAAWLWIRCSERLARVPGPSRTCAGRAMGGSSGLGVRTETVWTAMEGEEELVPFTGLRSPGG